MLCDIFLTLFLVLRKLYVVKHGVSCLIYYSDITLILMYLNVPFCSPLNFISE